MGSLLLSYLQCSDTVDWATRRAFSLQKPAPMIFKGWESGPMWITPEKDTGSKN